MTQSVLEFLERTISKVVLFQTQIIKVSALLFDQICGRLVLFTPLYFVANK